MTVTRAFPVAVDCGGEALGLFSGEGQVRDGPACDVDEPADKNLASTYRKSE